MIKKEIVEVVAEKQELAIQKTNLIINTFLNEITKNLKKGNKVVLTGFGTFSVTKKKQRKGRIPLTGEVITIKAHKAPLFRAGEPLKRAVK